MVHAGRHEPLLNERSNALKATTIGSDGDEIMLFYQTTSCREDMEVKVNLIFPRNNGAVIGFLGRERAGQLLQTI